MTKITRTTFQLTAPEDVGFIRDGNLFTQSGIWGAINSERRELNICCYDAFCTTVEAIVLRIIMMR